MGMAAENGHTQVVKWLNYNRTEGCTAEAMRCAVEYGHFEMVDFLQSIQKK
jgi:hypothetical protein